MKKLILLLMFMLCFVQVAGASGRTTILTGKVANKQVTGNIPEVDGLQDENLRVSANNVLKTQALALAATLPGTVQVDYQVFLNQSSLVSVLLTATNQSAEVYQGINLDLTTGKEAVLNDFLRLQDDVSPVLGTYEGLLLGSEGVYTSSTKAGAYSNFVSYKNLLPFIRINEAGRFLPVLKLTKAVDGKTVTLKAGEIIAAKLDANRTTGYGWELAPTAKNSDVIAMGSSYIIPANNDPKLVGVPGMDIILLGFPTVGTFNIQFEYKKTWEKFAASTVSFTVIVEA
ncbi:MAG: protease inhibitor I42 family protein [Acidaminococcaceae bacterium]